MTPAALHHCTSPPNIQIQNHHKTLGSIWRSREWRTTSKEYKARHPAKCSRCGKEGPIVPGHCAEDYLDIPTYIQKVRDDHVEPLCPRCNQQEAKGKHPCPSCIENHKADPEHRINYITQHQEQCRQCEPDYNPEASKFRHEHGNRIKNRLNRENYREHHPRKKVVNGVWVFVKPVLRPGQAVVKKGAKV